MNIKQIDDDMKACGQNIEIHATCPAPIRNLRNWIFFLRGRPFMSSRFTQETFNNKVVCACTT